MKSTKIAAVAAVALAGLLTYIGHEASTMVDQTLVPSENYGRDYQTAYDMVYGKYPELRSWHDSLAACKAWRDTTITTPQGIKLHGIIIGQPDSIAVGTTVMVHGYTDDAPVMMRYAYLHYNELHRHVLLPELQGCGLSEGKAIQMGWLDRLDLALWVKAAHDEWPEMPIIVHGLSMGAAATMMLSGETMDDSLRLHGFIEDCGYTSVWEQMKGKLKEKTGLPAFPLLNIASLITRMRYGWAMDEASALNQVRKSTLPMLFIHGDQDSIVPTPMVHELYAAKVTGHKELWIAPNSRHARSIHKNWEEYTLRTARFIASADSIADQHGR